MTIAQDIEYLEAGASRWEREFIADHRRTAMLAGNSPPALPHRCFSYLIKEMEMAAACAIFSDPSWRDKKRFMGVDLVEGA